MIVALFFYHSYLIWTCQTTKEHMKLTYAYEPNPHKKHPVLSFWNTLARNRRQSFTQILASCMPCTFAKPPADVQNRLDPARVELPNEQARIEQEASFATQGYDPQSPRLEEFMEVSVASNVVKAI